MGDPQKIVTAADMDRMSPQERADTADAGTVTGWDDVNPDFRDEVCETALRLGAQGRGAA